MQTIAVPELSRLTTHDHHVEGLIIQQTRLALMDSHMLYSLRTAEMIGPPRSAGQDTVTDRH